MWVFGYFRSSWTLRVELIADFVSRLLKHMRLVGREMVTVELRDEDLGDPALPWIDDQNFNPGYLMRDIHLMPKRLNKPEWQHTQNYFAECIRFPQICFSDEVFHFS